MLITPHSQKTAVSNHTEASVFEWVASKPIKQKGASCRGDFLPSVVYPTFLLVGKRDWRVWWTVPFWEHLRLNMTMTHPFHKEKPSGFSAPTRNFFIARFGPGACGRSLNTKDSVGNDSCKKAEDANDTTYVRCFKAQTSVVPKRVAFIDGCTPKWAIFVAKL